MDSNIIENWDKVEQLSLEFHFSIKNGHKYYHFGAHAVDIDDEVINKWIKDGLKSMIKDSETNPEKLSYFCHSGNTLICAFGYKEDDLYNFHFFVSKSFYTLNYKC